MMKVKRDRGCNGQALPLVVTIVWLVSALALLGSLLAVRAAQRGRAQSAADAAALAGAAAQAADRNSDAGTRAATEIAAANGGSSVQVTASGSELGVVVDVGSAQAQARAQAVAQYDEGLHPLLQAALQRAEVLLGEPVPIVSGYRSTAEQQALWDARHRNPYPVARPGTSAHELGMAVDVPSWFADRLAAIQDLTGLCQVLPVTDPIHFEPC